MKWLNGFIGNGLLTVKKLNSAKVKNFLWAKIKRRFYKKDVAAGKRKRPAAR